MPCVLCWGEFPNGQLPVSWCPYPMPAAVVWSTVSMLHPVRQYIPPLAGSVFFTASINFLTNDFNSHSRALSAVFCAFWILGNTLIALCFSRLGCHVDLFLPGFVLILLLPTLGLRQLELCRSKPSFFTGPNAKVLFLHLMLPFAVLGQRPHGQPTSHVNSENLPVEGFRWHIEQGGAPPCSMCTGNDHSHSRQDPAGAASPSESARWPQAIPPPAQRVVSKCALSEISDKE